MASFKEFSFTPAEFAHLAKIEKDKIQELELSGLLSVARKRVGNVDRKYIPLENAQNYFKQIRVPENRERAASAISFFPEKPKHKVQMFYNVKGGTGNPH